MRPTSFAALTSSERSCPQFPVITASASAIVYLLRGGIDAYAAGPTAVGVFVGATLGSRFGRHVDVGLLRLLFVAVMLFTAFEMARRALGAT